MTTEIKTITQAIAECREDSRRQPTSSDSLRKSREEYGLARTDLRTTDRKQDHWCMANNPSRQIDYCKNVPDCYFGPHETLAQLNSKYGETTSDIWLVAQLLDLSEYAGVRGKIKSRALSDCAAIISNEYYYLKFTELMLFFYKFKKSEYGRFYGSVDPLTIMSALKDFVEERNGIIERHEQQQRNLKDAEYRKTAISREEWEEMKKQRNAQRSAKN